MKEEIKNILIMTISILIIMCFYYILKKGEINYEIEIIKNTLGIGIIIILVTSPILLPFYILNKEIEKGINKYNKIKCKICGRIKTLETNMFGIGNVFCENERCENYGKRSRNFDVTEDDYLKEMRKWHLK